MGSDLALTLASVPVSLVDDDEASGLAMMLHQFLEQTLADSPAKTRLAGALRGEVLFRASEDEAIGVRIAFTGGGIQLTDTGRAEVEASIPSIKGDFLSIAHLTTGQDSPLSLLARRQLRAQFSLAQLPFLFRVLRLMRIDDEAPRAVFGARRWVWAAALCVLSAVAAYHLLSAP